MGDSAPACLQSVVLSGLPFSPESLSKGAFRKLDNKERAHTSTPELGIRPDGETVTYESLKIESHRERRVYSFPHFRVMAIL